MNYLKTGKSLTTFNSDPVSLQFSLRSIKENLMKDLDSDAIIKSGTTSWFRVNRENVYEVTDFVVRESGTY